MGRHEHEEADGRHGEGLWKKAGDSGPHEEIAQEALDRSGEEHRSGPTGGGGGVEEARKEAAVDADVLEDGDDVESGLVVALGGLERVGVDGEGVEGAARALDPYARRRRYPFAVEDIFCHFWFLGFWVLE